MKLAASALLLLVAPAAVANHLLGPMDDRSKACTADKCAAFNTMNTAPNFNGLGMSFATFTRPDVNSDPFIYDMAYALNVIGYTNNSYLYRPCKDGAAGGSCTDPQNLTAVPHENLTATFSCMCENCAATLEAIFQPIGRAICSAIGKDLPCAKEFDDCKKANAGKITSTGSLAAKNLKYPAVTSGASTDVCHPEAAKMGYKVGFNLTADCAADKKSLKVGGGATALALAKCVAKSRTEAYKADFNCLDIGGLDCGEPYKCTCPKGSSGAGCPPADPEPAKMSTSDAMTATIFTSLMVVVAHAVTLQL